MAAARVRPDDRRPIGGQGYSGKTALAQGSGQQPARQFADRPRARSRHPVATGACVLADRLGRGAILAPLCRLVVLGIHCDILCYPWGDATVSACLPGTAPALLVRPPWPPSAVAKPTRRARRSLSRLAFRGDAAADHGGGGTALFRCVPGALADRRGAGGGAARRRAGCLGGARLLRAGAQPACLRQAPGCPWRCLSRQRGGVAGIARGRRLYSSRGRVHRLRTARAWWSTAMLCG